MKATRVLKASENTLRRNKVSHGTGIAGYLCLTYKYTVPKKPAERFLIVIEMLFIFVVLYIFYQLNSHL